MSTTCKSKIYSRPFSWTFLDKTLKWELELKSDTKIKIRIKSIRFFLWILRLWDLTHVSWRWVRWILRTEPPNFVYQQTFWRNILLEFVVQFCLFGRNPIPKEAKNISKIRRFSSRDTKTSSVFFIRVWVNCMEVVLVPLWGNTKEAGSSFQIASVMSETNSFAL